MGLHRGGGCWYSGRTEHLSDRVRIPAPPAPSQRGPGSRCGMIALLSPLVPTPRVAFTGGPLPGSALFRALETGIVRHTVHVARRDAGVLADLPQCVPQLIGVCDGVPSSLMAFGCALRCAGQVFVRTALRDRVSRILQRETVPRRPFRRRSLGGGVARQPESPCAMGHRSQRW